MVLSSAKSLGKTIANQQKQIDNLKQEISPNDPSASFPLFTTEQIKITKSLEIYKRRMTGVYIVGNAVYGEIEAYPIGPLCVLNHPKWSFLNDCLLGDRDIDQYERTLLYSATL